MSDVSTDGKINNIAEALLPLVVPIESLHMDPQNARVHPERNMDAIKASLAQFGQVKPIVVRKDNGLIVAGNGTYDAARGLGWTQIAATPVEMDDVAAASYGLADNRTAELAKWDFEVVARLEKLMREASPDGQAPMIGWSTDELEVLRAADWTPPPITDGVGEDGEENADSSLLISFTPDQFEIVHMACERVRELKDDPKLSTEDCVLIICDQWLAGQLEGGDSNA